MNKQKATFVLVASVASVFVGFFVGYGIGQKTREATPSNVKTKYLGGVVTIEADVGGALKQGAAEFLSGL